MKNIENIFKSLLITLIVSSSSLNAQTVTTLLDPTVRDVSNVDFGFNRRSDNGSWWTDNSFINLISEMNPDIVRYPGGTQANYWDWREGKFIENTDKIWGNKEILKIPGFVSALPSRTKIIYVVNMARPTPITGVGVNASEAILKSNATLNQKIADMIAAIDEFAAQGKTPYAIELGNEFYFGNIESSIYQIVEDNGIFYSGWDAVNNLPYQSASKKDATDISSLFYLEQAKEVVSQIKVFYPNIKFALTTTKSGNGNSARERWNNTIFNNLENNTDFSALKNDVFAVTQHHYLNDTYGLQIPISDAASAKIAIAEGIQYPIDKQADYDMVPNDYKIWYTEFGEVKGIAEETWADAVRYAALNYSWLSRGDKVNQLDFHHLSDNTVIKVESPMRLAPIGIAAKQFMLAAAEMNEMQQINFNTNPVSVNGVLSLYGFKFKNNERETLLILNLNENDIPDIEFNNLFTYTETPTITQYNSNSPWISNVALGDSNIVFNDNAITTTFNALKFSITVIEAQNETLDLDAFSFSNFLVYPNPVEDILIIESEQTIKNISIFTLTGSKVLDIKNISNNTINLNKLASGIYILKIKTSKGLSFKKIVKK